MSEDPRRLRDDPETPPSVRDALDVARVESPATYDVVKGLARFEASLPASGGGTSSPTPPAPWKAAALGGAVVVALGLATLAVTRGSGGDPIATTPSAASRSAPAAPDASTIAAGASDDGLVATDDGAAPLEVASSGHESVPVRAPPSPRPTAASSARAATAASASSLEREMRELARARLAVSSDPPRGLVLAQQGEREFAGGFYSEEWQALVVIALARNGRSADANARARAFTAAHPKSPFNERIARELEKTGGMRDR